MSLNAYVWAGQLPLDVTSATAFRVLLKMADVADAEGRGVWLSRQTMADELKCSVRTIQRALNELKLAGLIVEGDKRAVAHIRHDRRPVVYDLCLSAELSPELPIDGVTNLSRHGVTNLARRDKSEPNGVTTVVTQTVTKPSQSPKSLNPRGPQFAPAAKPPRVNAQPQTLMPCSEATEHAFKFGICQHCNTARENLRQKETA